MSFPYVLDLAFDSEKATADPIGRLSFGKGSSRLPTTLQELAEMEQEGLAIFLEMNGSTLDLSDRERISQAQVDSLPENLAGVVAESTYPLDYTVSENPLTITLTGKILVMKGAYIILKQAID